MRKMIFLASSLLLFGVFNYAIYQKEQLKANGETVLLQLAPADPRSIMQGDYMALRYALTRDLQGPSERQRGYLVIAPDQNHVGKFVRFHQGEALSGSEKLLHYHNRYGSIEIVPDSFLFQEGHAQFYQRAKYGIFKFAEGGASMLVGLADEKYQPIRPE